MDAIKEPIEYACAENYPSVFQRTYNRKEVLKIIAKALDVEYVEHPNHDSMEQIKADALKGFTYYWDCPEICPEECRGRDEYPEVCCMTAQTLDLIARTEKLLGGGE